MRQWRQLAKLEAIGLGALAVVACTIAAGFWLQPSHPDALINSTGALADTMERARHYGRRAIDALAMFPSGRAKTALTEAVEFAVARAY